MFFKDFIVALFCGFTELGGALVAYGLGEFVLAGDSGELYDVGVRRFSAALCDFAGEPLDVARDVRVVVVGVGYEVRGFRGFSLGEGSFKSRGVFAGLEF